MEGLPEKPVDAIPEDNKLPLKVTQSEALARQGIDTLVRKTEVENAQGKEKTIALKEVRNEAFASDEKMKESKAFYDFLKSFPKFAKFVPETLFFKARMTADAEPRAYRAQEMFQGKRLDELTDEELYSDPVVVRQLMEFSEAILEIFEKAKEEGRDVPDLYGKKIWGNLTFNPRYTGNVMVTDQPSKSGQRVFFVDVSPQIQNTQGIGKIYNENIGSNMHMFQLGRWNGNLQERLRELEEEQPSKEKVAA